MADDEQLIQLLDYEQRFFGEKVQILFLDELFSLSCNVIVKSWWPKEKTSSFKCTNVKEIYLLCGIDYAIFIWKIVDDDECPIRLGDKFEVGDMCELGDSLVTSIFNFDGFGKRFGLETEKTWDKKVKMVEYGE